MSVRPIIDAGPGLNFLSINKERLLIAVLGPLSAPEAVRDEVLRKSRQDDRFRAAATVWRKLTDRWIQILSDDLTPELATAVQRISGLPMAERMKHAKDLGEIMVIAHAVVAADTVLARAAGTEQLPDQPTMRDTYRRLRELDDGFPPIEKTELLSDTLWLRAPRRS